MNKNLHNSVLYIDMCQLRRNAEAILQELDGAQLIPVLKGNAYGLGQEEVGAALAAIPEIRTMAVAQVSEGAALRRAGVTQDILVLGGVPVRLLAEREGVLPAEQLQEVLEPLHMTGPARCGA